MEEIKYIRPRVASVEIDIALDLFDRAEAMERITNYITGLLDDAESQFNRAVANANTGANNALLPDVVCCPSCGQEYTPPAPHCCIACSNFIYD